MRYINQNDEYSCGATAAYNALKWAKQRLNKNRDFQKVVKGCDCTHAGGSEVYSILKFLKKCLRNGYNVTRKRFVKLHEIESHIDAGGSVILCYSWDSYREGSWGHYILIIKKEFNSWSGETDFVVVNEGFKTVEKLSRKMLRKYTRKRYCPDQFRGHYPDAIFLSKRK